MKYIDITDKPPASEVADALIMEMSDYSKPTFRPPIEFEKKNSDYVPTGYDDLYRYYIMGNSSLCRKISRKFVRHGSSFEIDELVHDVFVRCIKKDVLKMHNPNKGNFGAIIFFVTRTICVNYLDKKGRDPLGGLLSGYIVEPDPGNDTPKNAHEYCVDDVLCEDSLEPALIAKLTVKELFDYLHVRSHNHTSMMDKKLSQLLILMLQEKTVVECAEALEIGKSTTYKLIKLLEMVCRDFIK